MTVHPRSPAPSPADADVARASSERLAAFLRKDRALTLTVAGAHGRETVQLPPSVGALLLEILQNMAAGSVVGVLRRDAELTTQQAADYLNVSRPFLVGLLGSGRCPVPQGRHAPPRAVRGPAPVQVRDGRRAT